MTWKKPTMMLRRLFLIVPFIAGLACYRESPHDSLPAPAPVLATDTASQPVSEKNEAPITQPTTAGSFRFAEGAAGQMLEKLLTSFQVQMLAIPNSKGASERPLPSALTRPEPFPTGLTAVPARYPLQASSDPKPAPPAERVPFTMANLAIELPARIELPVGALASWPTPDVKQPVSLPILARPSAERASLDDPTAEFTAASIISRKLPLRSTQAPFVKVNLPDPFEHANSVKTPVNVKEDPLTALGNPPPPKP